MKTIENPRYFKRYVEVAVSVSVTGEQKPLYIVWENQRKYWVERVIEKRMSVSSVGGSGVLYRCQIQGKERRLFLEGNRWFIESLRP